jgi:hypothetical protein
VENIGAWVCALKFGTVRCRVVMRGKYWCVHLNLALHGAGVRTKFSIAWCGLSGTCVILACTVCARIIMARVVCTVLTERRGILLVRVQCGYMLSRDNLINGARGVLVHGGGILKFGMVQRIECNACGILACDTKIVRNRY